MSFSQPFRVAWIDTDASGRIHYTAVFRWVEATEMALLRSLDLLADAGDYPRRHVEVEYVNALKFNDEIEVALAVASVGRTSIGFVWAISAAGTIAVRGRHTIVRVDDAGRPKPVEDAMRVALLEAAGVEERAEGEART